MKKMSFVILATLMIGPSFAATKEVNCKYFAATGTEQSFDLTIQDAPRTVSAHFTALSEMKEVELSQELSAMIAGISLTDTLIDVRFYTGKLRFFIPHTLTTERKNIKVYSHFDGVKTVNEAYCRVRE